MFEPLPPRSSAVRACADVIRRAILRRELAPGSRLPAERPLAEQLGVNRTTLRLALREVAQDGLLEVRQGSGYRVLELRESGGPDLVPALVELAREDERLPETCEELLRIRRALAGALLERLVAYPPSEALLDAVSEAVDRMEAAIGGSLAQIAAADLGVVSAWVAAAGSDVLAVFVRPVGRLLGSLPELAAAIYAEPAVNVALWRAMLAAVRAGAVSVEVWGNTLRERDADAVRRLGGQ
jgi:GntR family transcriptional repressor for pyruvate dehydrogenase complex